MSNIGIPIKLLYEAEGMKVTVEVRYSVEPREYNNRALPGFSRLSAFTKNITPTGRLTLLRVLSLGACDGMNSIPDAIRLYDT